MHGIRSVGRVARARLLVGAAVVVVAAGLVSGAAPVSAAPITLDECVQLALRHNLTLEQAQGALRSAGADVTGARSAFLPQLSASGRWTRPEEAIRVDRPQTQETVFYSELWNYGANASLLLFDGWGNVADYRSASAARDAAHDRFRDAQQSVVFETERRFFEVLKTEALVDVQSEAAKLSGEQLKKTQAMKDLGASTLADVYKSEVDHANNRLELLRAERNLQVARASLATYLGMAPRTELSLVAERLDVEADFDLDTALERAVESNPGLRAARASEEATASGVTSAKSARWPSLSAFYSAGYSFVEATEFNDENIDTNYGLSMNFSIFDGFLTKSRIRRAQSDLLTARSAVESTERDVQFEVQQAWLDLEIAREAIRVSEEAVRSSEEDLRFAQERFKVGEGTILDVIDAQVNLTRSRSSLVNATYDRRLAVSALHNAIGELPVPAAE